MCSRQRITKQKKVKLQMKESVLFSLATFEILILFNIFFYQHTHIDSFDPVDQDSFSKMNFYCVNTSYPMDNC